MLLFLFSYLYLAEVLKAYNLPMDYFTLGTYKAKKTCPLTIVVHKASNCIARTSMYLHMDYITLSSYFIAKPPVAKVVFAIIAYLSNFTNC